MPLLRPTPPKLFAHAFTAGLEEMIQLDRAPAGLTGCLVQRICVLTPRQAVSGEGLSGVRPGPWHFVTGSATGPALAITVAQPRRGRRPKMTSLQIGRNIQKFFDEVKAIEKLRAVRKRDYELRRLKVPGIIGAFWLVPNDGSATDLVIPYASVVPGLKGMKPYSIDEFLKRIRSVAQHKLDHPEK